MIKLMEDRSFVDGFIEVKEIQEDKIVLLYKNYCLSIEGKGLKITSFARSEMIIFGKMMKVYFDYND